MDMTSVFLTVHFNTNGTLESAVARREVVLTTTNKGRATGGRGYFYVTNADEMMELTDQASWKNGDEEAQADYFLYDSNLHFLTGSNHVQVRWPNLAPAPVPRRRALRRWPARTAFAGSRRTSSPCKCPPPMARLNA